MPEKQKTGRPRLLDPRARKRCVSLDAYQLTKMEAYAEANSMTRSEAMSYDCRDVKREKDLDRFVGGDLS